MNCYEPCLGKVIRAVDTRIIFPRDNGALSLRNGYVSLVQEPQSLLQILNDHISISIGID